MIKRNLPRLNRNNNKNVIAYHNNTWKQNLLSFCYYFNSFSIYLSREQIVDKAKKKPWR